MKILDKRKILLLAIMIFSFAVFSSCIFAYDEVIVHPSLTQEMAKLYNLNYSEKVSEQEIEWMKKGSTDEDMRQGLLIRSGNHFFNPFGIKKWADDTLVGNIVPEPKLTAKEWLHDSLEQDSFPGGDFTWERAIWDYVNGDRQHAYESLGHIMHLIEDSTVPAHVRNDLHISPNNKDMASYQNLPNFKEIKKALQDGEPYEAWTGGEAWGQRLNYNFAEKLFQANKKPLEFNSIDGYFDDIAKYTNTNFFSKDTIYTYSEPQNIIEGNEKMDNGDLVNYAYRMDENSYKIKLAKISYDKNKNQKKYTLIELEQEVENNIHSDYWSHLAPRAVLTGAGIIKLFKDEANKAAQNSRLIEPPKSIISAYSPFTLAIKVIDPSIRQIATVGQLLANAVIYTSEKILTAGQNIIISAYDSAKSSVIAFCDWGKAAAIAAYDAAKSTVVAAYDAVKTTTVTVFNKTKTGLQLAQEYAFTSISQYFSSSAKAQLEFDISKPLPAVYLLEDIISQAKAAENAEAAIVAALIYDAELSAVKNQKSVFSSGEEIALSAEIKNTGAEIWQGEKISLNIYLVKSDIVGILPQAELFNGVNVARDFAKQFYHSSWLTAVRPASLGKAQIESGAIGVFNFIVTAPLAAGDYFFRARPVWQGGSNEFEWIGDDIASWNIRVEAPPVEVAEKSADAPIENIEQSYEAEKQEEEILAEENDLPQEDDVGAIDENIEKEKLEKEALAVAEFARLAEEEATRLKEEDAARRRRASAWLTIPPETTILEFPENPTLETTASFKFSSTKANSTFLCSLDDSEFVSCGEYAIFENLAFGEYILKVKAKDEFGNIDETPEEYSWVIEKAESAPHLVISEIQIGGVAANDEFIELYNTTGAAIDLEGWDLKRKTSTGSENNILNNIHGIINPYGYFLIIPRANCGENKTVACYKGNVIGDDEYTTNSFMADNNTIILYDNDGKAIDKIGWGSALDFEGSVFLENPPGNQSLERKANFDSDSDSMASGGVDEFLGNGYDTDDNNVDFVLQAAPNPQNSESPAEPEATPTPTPIPTPKEPVYNANQDIYYAAIQTAIDAAAPGDKIQVDSGTYYENVNINKQLILEGIDTGGGKPIVDAKGNGSAIIISADNVALEGFSAINTANASGEWPIAGILVKSQKNIIKNNTVNSNDNGIVLYYSDNNEITGNKAFDNSNGIYLDYSNDNNLSNNATNSNNNGIVIVSGGNNILSDNIANSNDRGIYLLNASGNTITDNNADSNFYGISLESNSKNNIIKDNALSNNNIGTNSAGIYFYSDSNYNTITGNNISNNSYGIFSYYSSANIIYHNNIINNVNQAYDYIGNSNTWNSDYSLGGNYWSDYIGIDFNSGANQDEAGSDGIGDAPYIVIGYDDKVLVQDRYPLMQ